MMSSQFKEKIHLQDYSKKPQIHGVKILDLPLFSDDGGSFVEIARIVETQNFVSLKNFSKFKVKQFNWSQIYPGVVKAGHLHFKQDDIWFVPPGDRVLVGLIDVRKSSPTSGEKMRFVLGAYKAQLLYIPRGVIHGVANIWQKPATLIYLVNQYWTDDSKKCDEYRVSWEEFGDEFWEMGKG